MAVKMSRRAVVVAGVSAWAVAAANAFARKSASLTRVIIDNDFSGDPDGLFALAHHMLCSSTNIPFIIGSHLPPHFAWDHSPHQATDAANKARELLKVMGMEAHETQVLAGSEQALASRSNWTASPATRAIVNEAMRDDSSSPLFYAAGAGLTELAIAYLTEPKIGRRLKLVWIGGNEHADFALPPPGPPEIEFNFSIDPIAAQVIFNESDIEIWQVPRDVYRQMLVSVTELEELAAEGPLGRYLKSQVDQVASVIGKLGAAAPTNETYVLGDSPLVTLTALLSPFQPDASSSHYRLQPTPRLQDRGGYDANPAGRSMRIYTVIDSRLTFADMTSKFRKFSRRS
jgi:purine nucleosidase